MKLRAFERYFRELPTNPGTLVEQGDNCQHCSVNKRELSVGVGELTIIKACTGKAGSGPSTPREWKSSSP